MVKVFVGNLPREATESEIKKLFEKYGKVVECDIIKNYGFVHFEDKKAAEKAVRKLHHHKLHGVAINVETSKSKVAATTKLHVSNISGSCSTRQLKAKFEEYGPVLECDIVKDYAFVHMERSEDALEAIKGLDNKEFKGKRMHVQLSTSRLRTAPGMGEKTDCYRCGQEGHWSKECPTDRQGRGVEYTDSFIDQYLPVRAPTYTERMYDRDRYGVVDYYQRYRANPYAAIAYDPYAALRLATVAPMSTVALRDHFSATLDPYERHFLSATSASYLGRDRSPLRRSSAMPASVGNGYLYEGTMVSPASSVSRSALYSLTRYGRDLYSTRSRYTAC
ncbi:RNA-binding protein 4B-like [Ambystoma mexicanum]|uniref:RNA-binding protein 4B-like n=1 Tax=Ambystoma mexicanum TaxID=8296 RepID=UPI0037E8FCBA